MTTSAATLVRSVDSGVWILLAGFAALFGPLFPELISDWSRSGDFSHGFFVVPLAAYVGWKNRGRWSEAIQQPALVGGFVLVVGLLQYLLGIAASEYYLQRTAMVPFLLGGIFLFWGGQRARTLLFPVSLLLFMIPPPQSIWNTIAFPLQLLATQGTVLFLGLLQIPVERAGNVLHLSNCTLEVAAACSGLRSLVTLLFVGAILAEGTLIGSDRPRRTVFQFLTFLGAIPVAVALNSLRVGGTAAAASVWGEQAATGWIHDGSGMLTFVLSLALLVGWRKALGWIELRWFESPQPE